MWNIVSLRGPQGRGNPLSNGEAATQQGFVHDGAQRRVGSGSEPIWGFPGSSQSFPRVLRIPGGIVTAPGGLAMTPP